MSVNYATADGTAAAGSAYTARTGSVVFNPRTITRTFTIPVLSDVNPEADETYLVNLSGASNATIAGGQGTATVVDDETFGLGPTRWSRFVVIPGGPDARGSKRVAPPGGDEGELSGATDRDRGADRFTGRDEDSSFIAGLIRTGPSRGSTAPAATGGGPAVAVRNVEVSSRTLGGLTLEPLPALDRQERDEHRDAFWEALAEGLLERALSPGLGPRGAV